MAINKTYNNNITVNPTASTVDITQHDTATKGLKLGGTLVTASAAELNKLDGVTASTSEINKLAGLTSTTAELNTLASSGVTNADLVKLHAVTASAAEVNTLTASGVSNADLVKLHAITKTAAEINALGATALTVIDLNAASLTVTAATHGGALITVSYTAGTCTITLPAATGSGNFFRFLISAVGTNDRIIKVANSSDSMFGYALQGQGGVSPVMKEAAANDDTITLNGGAKGGKVGTFVTLIDFATNKWSAQIMSVDNGTGTSPWSNTV